MMYLIQILARLKPAQRKEFEALFSDLDYERFDMGWEGNEAELVNDMLFNHFGMTLEDPNQLKMLTEAILKPNNIKAALTVVNLKRA